MLTRLISKPAIGWHRFRRQFTKSLDTVLLAPAREGSLGDEAILQAVASNCSGDITLAYFGKTGQWSNLTGITNSYCFAKLLSSDSAVECMHLLNIAARAKQVIMPGTDVLDGYYSETKSLQRLKIANLCASIGTPTRLAAFSINPSISQSCIDAFRKLDNRVALSCRDSVSARRLEEATGHAVPVTADLAFLLHPDESSAEAATAIEWIEKQRALGRVIIGCNVNEHIMQPLQPGQRTIFVRNIQLLIDRMCKEDAVSLVFLPHDLRAPHDDRITLDTVHAALPQDVQQRCLKLKDNLTASMVKGVVGHCDVIITGRMHIAIASLGRGVPVFCFTYQGKFEGLFKHFDINDVSMSPSDALDFNKLHHAAQSVLQRRDGLRRNIVRGLPAIKQLALTAIN